MTGSMVMYPTQWLLLVVQFFLYGVGWLLAILLIRDMRRLLWQHSLSSFCLAAGMLLHMILPADVVSRPLPYTVASLLLLLGFAYACNGSAMFLRMPALSQRCLILGSIAASLPILLAGWLQQDSWRLTILSLETGLLLLWIISYMHQVSLREFPGLGTWLLHLATGLFGLFFVGRGILHALAGEAVVPELHHPSPANQAQGVAFMVMAAIFNLTATVRIAARLARQLHQLSLRDPLTGLLNRRALGCLFSEPYLQQLPCYSVIIVDIDHFKRINDKHGHSTGDAVLMRIGSILTQYSHDYCQVFRLGGEEFALLLSGESQAKALALAETLRRHIAGNPFTHDERHIHLTTSLGVAEGNANRVKLEQVLNAADIAMYEAKQHGRNRVHAAPAISTGTGLQA